MHLSFNLFTELGIDFCKGNCKGSLRRNKTKYDDCTSEGIKAIRERGGKNADRIIILQKKLHWVLNTFVKMRLPIWILT